MQNKNILDFNMCITLLANVLAGELSDEELELAGAVLTQFGDTLSTISAQREICRESENRLNRQTSASLK